MLPMKMTDRRPAVHPSRCGHHLAVHGSGPPYLFGFFIPFLFVFSFRTKQITHTDGRTDGLYYFSILFFLFWSFAITVCRLGDLVGSSFRCYGPQIDQRQRFDSPFRLKKFGLYFSRLFMAVK
jgi:hypothetical protein